MTQTGVQILTGFLLTVPFSNRFADLTAFQRDVYLAVLAGSVLTTGLVVAPVAMHRVLFRQRRRELLVESGNRFAMAGPGDARADRLRRRAARRRRRGRRPPPAGSPAGRSCSCSPCSGPWCRGWPTGSTTARATRHPPTRTEPGRSPPSCPWDAGGGSSGQRRTRWCRCTTSPTRSTDTRSRRGVDVVGQRPGATTDQHRVQEQVHVVDQPGAERLGREGRPADADVEHARGLELLDRRRVERRGQPGPRGRDVLEGGRVDDLVGRPPDPGVLPHRPGHVTGRGLPVAHRLVQPAAERGRCRPPARGR